MSEGDPEQGEKTLPPAPEFERPPGLVVSVSRKPLVDPVIGTTVSGYVVKGKLGAGGMGIVYEGEQPVIGKRVAIKVLRPEIAENPEQVARLVAEARAVNSVGHRGIIDVFGFGELPDGRQCIVMEYLDGESLSDILKRNTEQHRTMTTVEVMIILEEILSALGAAHGAGVIHRDLKPSNIYLARQRDGSRYVKLLDFGIAKLGVLGKPTPSTRASMLVGTPSYMAPEQARGGLVGPGMDLYATGIMAFEMLTGQLPFVGDSVVEVLMKHAEQPAPKPSTVLLNIPDSIDDLILSLLAKKPEQRPQRAEDVRLKVVQIRKTLAQTTSPRSMLSLPTIGGTASDNTVRPQKPDLGGPIAMPSARASSELDFLSKGPRREIPDPKPTAPPVEAAKPAPADGVLQILTGFDFDKNKPPPPTKQSNAGWIVGIIGVLFGLAALGFSVWSRMNPPQPGPGPKPPAVEIPAQPFVPAAPPQDLGVQRPPAVRDLPPVPVEVPPGTTRTTPVDSATTP